MKKVLSIITILFIFILSACTPEEISNAIEDCQNDPDCNNVVDSAISEELESRGITGGLMTEAEIVDVQNVLASYIYEEQDMSEKLNQFLQMFVSVAQINDPAQADLISDIETELRRMDPNNNSYMDYFDLASKNTNLAQLFIEDTTKYILYKTGASSYHYEVQADTIYRFTIDTDLDKVYLNDTLLEQPQNALGELLSGTYTFTNIRFEVDDNVIFYEFPYDGYLVGTFDMDTDERYEIAFYDFGYDIMNYTGTIYQYGRYNNSTFTGTFDAFLSEGITNPLHTLEEQQLLQALQTLWASKTLNYTIDFTTTN
jgi:hypothetical protein